MHLIAELRRHPRPLWALFFATLVNRLGLMVLPFLALYLTQELRYSTAQAGVVVGVYGVGGLSSTSPAVRSAIGSASSG